MKKILWLGIAVLLCFSLMACNDFDLAACKLTAKAEIENYVTEGDYCAENWSIVCGIVDAGKTAVDRAENKIAVDTAVCMAKEEIDEVEIREFILTISAEKAVLSQGENFRVNLELKNNSGKNVEIEYGVLFWLYTPDIGGRPQVYLPTTRFFEASGVIQEVIELDFANLEHSFGISLGLGAHEFIFSAHFYLEGNVNVVEILSNTVVLVSV